MNYNTTIVDYNMSIDYKKMYKDLKRGKKLVGFTVIAGSFYELNVFEYNSEHNCFHIGIWLKDDDIKNIDCFCDICKQHKIKFIRND
jgi:virulence-associated protein VapD